MVFRIHKINSYTMKNMFKIIYKIKICILLTCLTVSSEQQDKI